jgi:hypothetical protein
MNRLFLSKVKFPFISLLMILAISGCTGENSHYSEGATISGGTTYNIGTDG